MHAAQLKIPKDKDKLTIVHCTMLEALSRFRGKVKVR
jgi:hypothetical protein